MSLLSDTVQIVPVQTKAQWHDFHHLPFKIYRNDPQWVAPLLLERQFHFQPKHNPYFQHGRAAFFLAYRGKEPVGRITAQIDQLHLDRYQDATGHFGFIEAVDDPEVFSNLLKAAEGVETTDDIGGRWCAAVRPLLAGVVGKRGGADEHQDDRDKNSHP